MSEKENILMKKLTDGIPKLSDFDKGYFLGVIEARALTKESEEKETEEKEQLAAV